MRVRTCVCSAPHRASALANFHEFTTTSRKISGARACREACGGADAEGFSEADGRQRWHQHRRCDEAESTIDRGDWHGDAPFYPASVVKLYIMAEVFHQKFEHDPEVARALGEMIRLSITTPRLTARHHQRHLPGAQSGRTCAEPSFMDKRRWSTAGSVDGIRHQRDGQAVELRPVRPRKAAPRGRCPVRIAIGRVRTRSRRCSSGSCGNVR